MARCGECGLVAMEDCQTGLQVEVPLSTRTTGITPPGWDNSPLCSLMVYDLRKEHLDMIGSNSPSRTLKVLNDERKCEKVRKWMHGFSPKEHAQKMFDELSRERERENRWRERWSDRLWSTAVGIGMFILGLIAHNYLGFKK